MANISAYKAKDESEQLSLTVQEGDICARLDVNKLYMALNELNRSMSDWISLLTLGDAVSSVDGLVGKVSLRGDYVSEADAVHKTGDDDIRGSKKFFGRILSYHGSGEGEYGADFVSLGNDNVILEEVDGKARLSGSGDIELVPGGGNVTRNLGDLDVGGDIILNGTINNVDLVSLKADMDNIQTLSGNVTSVDGKRGAVSLSGSYAAENHEHSNGDIADALGFAPENTVDKGKPGGYASLDEEGKIHDSQMPDNAPKFHTAKNEDAQLALSVQPGDICKRSDLEKSYVALSDKSDSMDSWQELRNYAFLGADGHVPKSQLPTPGFNVHRVNDEVGQLALMVNEGDVCARLDQNRTYIAIRDKNDCMEDWQELLFPEHPKSHPADMIEETEVRKFISDGEQAIKGNKTFDDNLTVHGNLIINGDTVAEISNIEDNIITLNSSQAGHPAENGGLEINRGNEAKACFLWDEDEDAWKAGEVGGLQKLILENDERLTDSRKCDNSFDNPDAALENLGLDQALKNFSEEEIERLQNIDDSITNHADHRSNPHRVTKDQIGLGENDDVKFQTVNNRDPKADGTKLDGIEKNANNYLHPQFHSAGIIDEDADHRFVSEVEKRTWNSKQDAIGFTPENATNKGQPNGHASLDGSGKIPVAQLPNLSGGGSGLEEWSVKTTDATLDPDDILKTIEYQNGSNDRTLTIAPSSIVPLPVGAWFHATKTGGGEVTIARDGVAFRGPSGNVDVKIDGNFQVYFVQREIDVWEYCGAYKDV